MNLFGAIAAIPAISAYRKAKSDYQALLDKKTAMEAAVRTYNQTKNLMDDGAIEDKSVDHMPGVLTTTIVRFGAYMFGTIWMRPSVVFTNMSDNDYTIEYTRITGLEILKKYGVVLVDRSGNEVMQFSDKALGQSPSFILKANDTLEVPLDGGYTKLINPTTKADETQKLWDTVWEAQQAAAPNQPLLVQRQMKVQIDGAVKASIHTLWMDKNGNAKHSVYRNKPGVIFYGK